MTRTVRASPAGSRLSSWHLGSKFGQARCEHAVPLTATRRRSALPDKCVGAATWLGAGVEMLAAGAAVIARAMTPATTVAAAILRIGLDILSPLRRVSVRKGNVPTGRMFPTETSKAY